MKSEPVCPTWNWHPFCLNSKPNSVNLYGVLNNTSGEKKYFLDYYLDSFDTDIPVGISLKLNNAYYVLRKTHTDYTDAIKIRSELGEDLVKAISENQSDLVLSYSSRVDTINLEFSKRQSENFRSSMLDVVKQIESLEKMKIIKK